MPRYFDADCKVKGRHHQPGDRHWEIGACDDEWTGSVWTRVCPHCDLPMDGRDVQGWLCCAACGMRATEVPVRAEKPAGVA